MKEVWAAPFKHGWLPVSCQSMNRVTLGDVAKAAGVSRSAVSRNFTPGSYVSDEKRKLIGRVAKNLGYTPNRIAGSLRNGRTRLIGLVSDNYKNPAFLEVFDLLSRGLQAQGLLPVLINLSDEVEPDKSVRLLSRYSVEGVIIASSTLPCEFPEAFRDAGIPVVHAFGRLLASPSINVVGIGNVECGRMAAQKLIERGYRKVGFLGGPPTASSTIDRIAGFSEVIGAAPDATMTYSFASKYSYEAGNAEMHRLMAKPLCEAYFCCDDAIAIGAISALNSVGIGVPDDVGIVGFNDMKIAGWQNFNLTTIRQPIENIVRASIELLTDVLQNKNCKARAVRMPTEFVERGTLRCLNHANGNV
ncbi:MAG: LacI family DNA-binding transcriptional regulator [Yoonia sp.]|nr:LacI family DNA-binding transcriptional regulator [Yoonia sp.]